MPHLKLERVRQAQKLVIRSQGKLNQEELISLIQEFRQIGRPDIAYATIMRVNSYNNALEFHKQKILTLAALGKANEAALAVNKLVGFSLPIQIRLIAVVAQHKDAITIENVRKILNENCFKADPLTVLASFPLKLFSQIYLVAWYKATTGISWRLRIKLLISIIFLRLINISLNVTANAVIKFVRFFIGRQQVLIASMGEFTRLADVIDRLDPVLRRLRDVNQTERLKPPHLVVLYFGGYPNETLFEMYSRHCTLLHLKSRLAKALVTRGFNLLKLAGMHCNLTVDYREIKEDFANRLPIIQFSQASSKILERELMEVGIDTDRPIICFGLRDLAYYDFYGQVMGINTASVKRSDTWHRCPPLENYIAVANYWADRGYQVVRMGLRVTAELPKDRHPSIIDYAVGSRSDRLDAFLFSRCDFLLAGDTGLFSGAAAFDRPSVLSDLFLVRNTMYSSNKLTPNIFVPKLVLDHIENRFLSFSEWIYFNHLFSNAQDCENSRFELIHNTAEDIVDATQELADRLNGSHITTPQEIEMQECFRALYSPYQVGYQSTGLVSSSFLRKYSYLLH